MMYIITYRKNSEARKNIRLFSVESDSDDEAIRLAKYAKQYGLPEAPGPLHKVTVFRDKKVFLVLE